MLEEKSVIVLMKKKNVNYKEGEKLGMFLVYIIISYSDSFPLK